jgi:hypothetical protein
MKNNERISIKPKDLDLVMRDEDFVIYYQNEPVFTRMGKEVAHTDARLLRHILTNITLNRAIDFKSVNALSLLSFILDNVENDNNSIQNNINQWINSDLLLKNKLDTGEKKPFFKLDEILDYIEENPQTMNLIFWGVSVISQSLRDLLSEMENYETIEKKLKDHKDAIISFLFEKYESLSPEQRSAIDLLSVRHSNGLLLPMMLVLSKVSPSEYASNSLALHTNLQVIDRARSTTNPEGIGISPLKVSWMHPDEAIECFSKEANQALEFLGFFGKSRNKISVISELISQGEHDKMEFKSTFRWDIRQNKKSPAIEHAALKTMAAFLNSDGGDLLIGVEDDGAIYGIEADGFPNDDKFLLHVWTLIKSSMGQDVSPYIKTTLEKFANKTVCRVHCLRSTKPLFLRQKGFAESFYIRIGPSSGSLEISEALKYIGEHF